MWRTRNCSGMREQISSGSLDRIEEALRSAFMVERSMPQPGTMVFLTLVGLLGEFL